MIKRFKIKTRFYDQMSIKRIEELWEIGLLREGLLCESGEAKGMYFKENKEQVG